MEKVYRHSYPTVISPLPCCLVIHFLLYQFPLPSFVPHPRKQENPDRERNTPRTRTRLSSLVNLIMDRSWPGLFFFLGAFLSLGFLSLSPFSSFSLFLLRASVCNVWMFFLFLSFFFFFVRWHPFSSILWLFFNLSTHTHIYIYPQVEVSVYEFDLSSI